MKVDGWFTGPAAKDGSGAMTVKWHILGVALIAALMAVIALLLNMAANLSCGPDEVLAHARQTSVCVKVRH